MPTFTLDNQIIETSPGKTIIQAAYDNGLQVPHFCWHPALSVAGNCRMCLVEVGMPARDREGNVEKDEKGGPKINFMPKLQIACATPVSDGMVVRSVSDTAVEAQEAVMEFLLINHPLDCPICDEAGECKLQEYAFKNSRGESRFEEQKVHKPKRQQWGPNVIYDAERCISCSRCIRFAQEVAKQDVLTFVQRGDHVTIELFDGTVFDNPYSMNVIEICPVGALTSEDFRFKARVWDMSFNDSISFADGSGSNTTIGVRNNEILRIEPRPNPYVNEYWLTDDARLNHYDFVNNNRITEPHAKINGEMRKVSWEDAFSLTAKELMKFRPEQVFFLASAKATNESNHILKKFASEVMKSGNIGFLSHTDESFEDGFLGTADRTPNSSGAKALGISEASELTAANFEAKMSLGEIRCLVVMEEDFKDYEHLLAHLDKLSSLIVIGWNHNELSRHADIVLPAATYAESEGTFTSIKGRVQHFKPALSTKENLRYMGLKMSRLDKFGAYNDRWSGGAMRNCKMSWRILTGIANAMGADWGYKKSEDVFAEIESGNAAFAGMSYRLLDEYQGLVLGKAGEPDPKVNLYVSHVMKPH